MRSINYTNAFIAIAEDCKAVAGIVPPRAGTIAALQYTLLAEHPYALTSDELLVAVEAARRDIPKDEWADLQDEIFSKSQACLRTSPLAKTYGWGLHHDGEGRVALVGCETDLYQRMRNDPALVQTRAMRSRKARGSEQGGAEMAKTVIIEEHGGPEVLKVVDREVGQPGAGEIRIRHKAVGLNFIDTYQRSGLYPMSLPHALGREAAGIVEAVGEGVTHLAVGDRAAYASDSTGSYCEERVMPAGKVCKLPDSISFEEGAAMMLKGLTVQYLFHRTTPLKAGDTVLFHAAAGGVGLIACQWAKSEGIRLIGTAGTDAKCKLALDAGAEHCINYSTEDWVAKVRDLTGGKGVDVVMDSIGKDTFDQSLDCLKPLGMMISFGNATGPVTGVNLGVLAAKGSLKVTRPSLFAHIADFDTCQEMAAMLFGKVADGSVKISIDQTFTLDQVADAHRALESRKTTGQTILTV